MYRMIFCKDGNLRVQKEFDSSSYPLISLQKFQSKDDYTFIISNLGNTVIFEDGLTVFSFLKCLEPWISIFEVLTNVKISEYLAECRKPTTIEKVLDYVNIKHVTEISPEVEYENDETLETSDPNEWLNLNHKKRLNGKWSIDSYYNVTGHIIGNSEHYSVDHTPFNKLANLPIYLDSNEYLSIDCYYLKEFNLMNDLKLYGGIPINNNIIVIGTKSHTLYDVINGFFHWIPCSISNRDNFINKLLDIKAEMESNSSFLNQTNNKDKTKKEIIVSENAFDELIENSVIENNYWDTFKQFTKKENITIRIGEISENLCPEDRFLNHIINKDQKTKPTEFL